MELYLLRHGLAEASAATGRDADRALSAAGIARLEAVLKLARRSGLRPSLILSSPFARAVQTAEIANRCLECSAAILRTAVLSPDSSPYRVWEELRAHAA